MSAALQNRFTEPGTAPRGRLSRFFAPHIEDSLRLRALVLASLWLAGVSLVWVGGDLLFALLGGVLGTLGYWVGWRWRYQRSLLRPLLIAGVIIALSIYMRSQMLEALNGNWLPLGQFLVLVQALSSFDSRTRGGLYAGLILSGTVLFFASQQAFEPSFGIFIVGFVVLLLGFLTIAFLEDGIKGSQVHWAKGKTGTPVMLPHWIGIACAVFTLSAVAFWLMPRDQLNLVGSAQLSVLPYSGESLDPEYVAPALNLSDLIRAPEPPDGPSGKDVVEGSAAQESRASSLSPVNNDPAGLSSDRTTFSRLAGSASAGKESTSRPAILSNLENQPKAKSANDPVLFVRTKITSYWQGRTLEEFDGASWVAGSGPNGWVASRNRDGIWFNPANLNRNSRALYQQTFYVREDDPESIFTGYSAVSMTALNGPLDGVGVKGGTTYRVLSSYPDHNPRRLLRDSTWVGNERLLNLPQDSLPFLLPLASKITDGADSDFEKIERIVDYLRREGNFTPTWPEELTGSAQLDEFLVQGEPGNAMDYATATVMLARASGLPARLAVGYLPGIRDPLSGAYRVTRSDAHAWAEIYFANNGWIPFDSSPRSDLAAGGTPSQGVGFLFQAGIGDAVFGAVKSVPTQIASFLFHAVRSPMFSLLAAALLLVGLVLRWAYFHHRRRRTSTVAGWRYRHQLVGENRKELLGLYRQVEKQLQRKSGVHREPWQTVGDFTSVANPAGTRMGLQLSWFARAAWQAAYNPQELPEGLVNDARERLQWIKQTLNTRERLALAD